MSLVKRLFKIVGPGFITGASDDDPSGIATYSQTGAQWGYTQLWTAVFFFPFMTVVQEMCGRIGLVTGKGLAQIIKQHYPAPILYGAVLILFVANTVNIGADLAAMAETGQLLFGWPIFPCLITVTLLSIGLQVFVPYSTYSKFLKYLSLSLFAYIITALVVRQDWGHILHDTLIPHISFSSAYLMNLVGLLGTTISPYLFFWQASEEVEQAVEEGRLSNMGEGQPRFSPTDIQEMRWDTAGGMFFSQLIMFFIMVTTASTLGAKGLTQINTAAEAAQALRPIAGQAAFALFSIGILGTGLLAVPVLAGSAAYAISETLGWPAGLYKKPEQALGFYGIITAATLLGFCIHFTHLPPFKLLSYSAVLTGLCAPPLMALILLIAGNPDIMRQQHNRSLSNQLGWFITALMAIAGIALIINLINH